MIEGVEDAHPIGANAYGSTLSKIVVKHAGVAESAAGLDAMTAGVGLGLPASR